SGRCRCGAAGGWSGVQRRRPPGARAGADGHRGGPARRRGAPDAVSGAGAVRGAGRGGRPVRRRRGRALRDRLRGATGGHVGWLLRHGAAAVGRTRRDGPRWYRHRAHRGLIPRRRSAPGSGMLALVVVPLFAPRVPAAVVTAILPEPEIVVLSGEIVPA